MLTIDFEGNVHKIEFDPFNPRRFTVLFENHMLLFSDNVSHIYYFGKWDH